MRQGIATDRDQLGIVPYSKDLGLIFTEIACALIRAGCLEVFVSAGSQKKIFTGTFIGSRLVYRNRGRFSSHYRADKGRSQRSSTLEAIPHSLVASLWMDMLLGR